MLDLNNPIVYSAAETATINDVMATGNSGPDMWADCRVHDVKHHISVHTLTEQGCLCAYCEALLKKGTTSIEHFVPKSRHREFTFEPVISSFAGETSRGQLNSEIMPPVCQGFGKYAF